jgi:hypothetical protein
MELDQEMKDSDNPYFSLFEEPAPSKFLPKPDPMVEDGTFYDARSSVYSPSKEDPVAPRQGEYANPWKFPLNNCPVSRKELRHQDSKADNLLTQAERFWISDDHPSHSARRHLHFEQWNTPPSTPSATTTPALIFQDQSPQHHPIATQRMEPSVSQSNPALQHFTSRNPIIRPSSLTPQKDGTTNSGLFSTPGASYQPTVTFGRPESSTAMFSPDASALSAPPVTWYPPTIEMPHSNLPSISYHGASALHPQTVSHGSTPTAPKATVCPTTTSSVDSSVRCSIQSTIRNLTSDSSATESTTPNGYNSPWTPVTPSTWKSNEYMPPPEEIFGPKPLILPFRKHQTRYGRPVKWIKTHPNSYWELQQLGKALPLERFCPPPLIPIGRLQTHCRPSPDFSISSNSNQQLSQKS